MTDPFVHDDAAYVLGALEEPERVAFEAHLLDCPGCAARVRSAAPVAQLLADAPVDAFGAGPAGPPVPGGLFAQVRRRADAERRRTRWRARGLAGGLAAMVAACVAVLAFVVWPAETTSPEQDHGRQMRPVAATSLRASAELAAEPWGTRIDVDCWYKHGYAPPGPRGRPGGAPAYQLVVLDDAGERHPAGSWRMTPGAQSRFTGGTDVPRRAITGIQIMADGRAVLVLSLR